MPWTTDAPGWRRLFTGHRPRAPRTRSHAALMACVPTGTVVLLYCPFSGPRLDKVLAELEDHARAAQVRVCSVDLPLPPRRWLRPLASGGDVTVMVSPPTLVGRNVFSALEMSTAG